MRQSGRAWAGLLLLAGALCWGKSAAAEVVLLKTDGGFEFFTEGRLGGFFEAVQGQTLPTRFDQNGNLTHTIGDGGIDVGGLYTNLPMGAVGQGTVLASRVRSGFLGNILAFGLRRKLTDTVTVTGYISIWANIEDENQRAFVPAFPDAREGFVRVTGPAGSLLVGRTLTLFSRGATEIDFLYGHRYGVGNPAGFTTQGPCGRLRRLRPAGGHLQRRHRLRHAEPPRPDVDGRLLRSHRVPRAVLGKNQVRARRGRADLRPAARISRQDSPVCQRRLPEGLFRPDRSKLQRVWGRRRRPDRAVGVSPGDRGAHWPGARLRLRLRRQQRRRRAERHAAVA